MRTISLSLLTILCLALTGFAQVIYNDGGIDGNDNAFFITGPNNPNFLGSFQDISNGFIAAASSSYFTNLEFGEWLASGFTPSSIGYEFGTTAFGTDVGVGTVALGSWNSHFLFTNALGYDVYDITIPVNGAFMTAGNEYWLSLSNAADSQGNNSTEAWDIPNFGSGGPATCNFRQSGTNLGDCGLGGESFTLSAYVYAYTPEPSSIMLFGSGILGLAGILRRKLKA
jgi:PEP-CTERM motif